MCFIQIYAHLALSVAMYYFLGIISNYVVW